MSRWMIFPIETGFLNNFTYCVEEGIDLVLALKNWYIYNWGSNHKWKLTYNDLKWTLHFETTWLLLCQLLFDSAGWCGFSQLTISRIQTIFETSMAGNFWKQWNKKMLSKRAISSFQHIKYSLISTGCIMGTGGWSASTCCHL